MENIEYISTSCINNYNLIPGIIFSVALEKRKRSLQLRCWRSRIQQAIVIRLTFQLETFDWEVSKSSFKIATLFMVGVIPS